MMAVILSPGLYLSDINESLRKQYNKSSHSSDDYFVSGFVWAELLLMD